MPGAKLARALFAEGRAWKELLCSGWPESPLGSRLRHRYWSARLHSGPGCSFGRLTTLGPPGLVQVGRQVSIGSGVIVDAAQSSGIYLGDHVLIAPGCFLRGANHVVSRLDVPMALQGHTAKVIAYQGRHYSIVVEDDVWLAAGVIVVSGAFIGRGSIIAAGAVVTGHVSPNSVMGGIPAKLLFCRAGGEADPQE